MALFAAKSLALAGAAFGANLDIAGFAVRTHEVSGWVVFIHHPFHREGESGHFLLGVNWRHRAVIVESKDNGGVGVGAGKQAVWFGLINYRITSMVRHHLVRIGQLRVARQGKAHAGRFEKRRATSNRLDITERRHLFILGIVEFNPQMPRERPVVTGDRLGGIVDGLLSFYLLSFAIVSRAHVATSDQEQKHARQEQTATLNTHV